MSAKHTSGPLLAINFGNSDEWDVVKHDVKACNGYWNVAQCFDDPDDGTAKANACLFAAAPDLLEAVNRLLVCMRLANWENDDAAIFARAAIAKAEGGAA
jgi:hypothetical protein